MERSWKVDLQFGRDWPPSEPSCRTVRWRDDGPRRPWLLHPLGSPLVEHVGLALGRRARAEPGRSESAVLVESACTDVALVREERQTGWRDDPRMLEQRRTDASSLRGRLDVEQVELLTNETEQPDENALVDGNPDLSRRGNVLDAPQVIGLGPRHSAFEPRLRMLPRTPPHAGDGRGLVGQHAAKDEVLHAATSWQASKARDALHASPSGSPWRQGRAGCAPSRIT